MKKTREKNGRIPMTKLQFWVNYSFKYGHKSTVSGLGDM